jgi:hypothetical protein
MRHRLVLGLAVVLVLAGCQGAPIPGDDATPSTIGGDPAGSVGSDTPQHSTVGPNASSFSFPNGTSPDGVDPAVVPATHHETLVNAQRYVMMRSRTAGNQSIRSRFVVDHDRRRVRGERTVTGPESQRTIDVWATQDTAYYREGEPVGNGSFFGNYEEVTREWSSREWTAGPAIGAVLETYRFEADTVVTRNGSRVVRYRSTGLREPAAGGSSGVPSNGTATLAIDEAGVVRSIVVQPSQETDDRIAFRIDEIGAAEVDRPEWVDVAVGPAPVEVPDVNLTANASTVELRTANEKVETTAVWIHHQGGASVNASALDVTANRARAYDVRSLTSANDTLAPTRPFAHVGERFDPGESVRIVHTVSPRLYGGAVRITNGSVRVANRSGARTFPMLESDRSLRPGQGIRVLWNRSRPQTLLTYTVESPGPNRSVTTED